MPILLLLLPQLSGQENVQGLRNALSSSDDENSEMKALLALALHYQEIQADSTIYYANRLMEIVRKRSLLFGNQESPRCWHGRIPKKVFMGRPWT